MTSYRVLRSGTGIAQADVTAYVDKTPRPGSGATVTYSVVAFDLVGNASPPGAAKPLRAALLRKLGASRLKAVRVKSGKRTLVRVKGTVSDVQARCRLRVGKAAWRACKAKATGAFSVDLPAKGTHARDALAARLDRPREDADGSRTLTRVTDPVVRLDRIYTRGGDAGETSLGDGRRVSKAALRIAAYGSVDELGAVLGLARTHPLPDGMDAWLGRIQNDLFDLGADLCVPEEEREDRQSARERTRLRVTPEQVVWLEERCDEVNEKLPPLTSFVLAGGTPAAAVLHLARTVCRRAERESVALAASEAVGNEALQYLNRLSDLLFLLARAANPPGAEVLWVPGGERS